MSDPEIPRLTADKVHSAVAKRLAEAFDAVAKEAIQAAAMARDPSIKFSNKLDNAHDRVTLIVETAMRGLGKANRTALKGVALFLTQEDEEEDGQEQE